MNISKTLKTGAAILSILAFSATHAATWKLAMEEQLDDVQGKFATKFKEVIEKNTKHKVKIFPVGTLGETNSLSEQTQAGLIQFVIQSPGFTASIIPEVNVFLLPYIFPENVEKSAEFFKSSQTMRTGFDELYREKNLKLLTFFPEGELYVNSHEPFRSPADLKGKKIRVQTSPILIETYKTFGSTPTPLTWGEVFTGLQTKLLDGHENPLFWVNSQKLYEVTGALVRTRHNTYVTSIMANAKFYDKLSDKDRAAVNEATEEALNYILDYQADLSDQSLQAILKADPDMEVVELTDEEIAVFREASKNVKKTFFEMTGEKGKILFENLQKDKEKAIK